MARSPHCGPAAVERSSPCARDNRRPIIFLCSAALLRLCSHVCGLHLASQLALAHPSTQQALSLSLSLSSGVLGGVQRSSAPGG
ncbi:hypothetical protein KUCAC02_025322 [Chaenocephalus aceratus]|uniref:Uncharacterized protein n=1 Tax=Chaenocephalus aceratus TaxID=36190 RepID=A0ACB9VTL1_CHAAC|nr:hypothetical protein KUCAC02_025322 [Chaenocephalus aceratus]